MVSFFIATMSCRLLGISLPPGVQVAVRFVFEQLKWQTRRLGAFVMLLDIYLSISISVYIIYILYIYCVCCKF